MAGALKILTVNSLDAISNFPESIFLFKTNFRESLEVISNSSQSKVGFRVLLLKYFQKFYTQGTF